MQEITDISELSNGRSALNIAPTIEELEPLLESFPNTHYVGQLLFLKQEIGPLWELKEDSSLPLIFVYMSRGSITSDIFVPALRRAFKDGNFLVAVAMRDKMYSQHPLPCNLEPNIRLYDMLPGMSAINRSSLVITRGGQNTTMACMLAGKPFLGFPGDSAEADFNVRTIDRLRAGKLCAVEDMDNLLQIVGEVLGNDAFTKNAQHIGHKIRQFDGAHLVVRLMEDLI